MKQLSDEAFNRRLAANMRMTTEQKARRLAVVDKMANKPVLADIGRGERFDELDFPTDLPITPECGDELPSVRFFGGRR
jgi:hypothetical protein